MPTDGLLVVATLTHSRIRHCNRISSLHSISAIVFHSGSLYLNSSREDLLARLAELTYLPGNGSLMLNAVKLFLPASFHLFSALLRHIILYYVVMPGLVARQTDISLPQMHGTLGGTQGSWACRNAKKLTSGNERRGISYTFLFYNNHGDYFHFPSCHFDRDCFS